MDKAILITYDKEDAINEAKGLCEAAGYEVVHIIRQNYLQKPKYGISGGVLEQLREMADKIRPDVIVFESTPPALEYWGHANENTSDTQKDTHTIDPAKTFVFA